MVFKVLHDLVPAFLSTLIWKHFSLDYSALDTLASFLFLACQVYSHIRAFSTAIFLSRIIFCKLCLYHSILVQMLPSQKKPILTIVFKLSAVSTPHCFFHSAYHHLKSLYILTCLLPVSSSLRFEALTFSASFPPEASKPLFSIHVFVKYEKKISSTCHQELN